jgi:hypothetical protein
MPRYKKLKLKWSIDKWQFDNPAVAELKRKIGGKRVKDERIFNQEIWETSATL